MGKAAELAAAKLEQGVPAAIAALRDLFESILLEQLSGVMRNGNPEMRLPNTSHLSFEHCEAAGLLILLDEWGFACSAGSACMAGKQHPSHVQKAMGFSDAQAKSSLRLSFTHQHTEHDVRLAADAVMRAVKKLRSVQGSGVGPVVIYTP